MRKIYKFAVVSLVATFMLSLTSCDVLFDPALENRFWCYRLEMDRGSHR